MDNDHLGGHIKSVHKMKEKAYKEQYIVSNTKAMQQNLKGNLHKLKKDVSNGDVLKKVASKKGVLKKDSSKKDTLTGM